MNTENLNHWLSLIANVAVVAGIIFLAIELNQNTKQLQLQSYQSWAAANVQINMAIADPELSAIAARGHDDSANLSEDTYVAYAMFHMAMLQMAQSTHYLYLQGAIDQELWQAEMDRAAGILTLPGVRQWWNAGGRTQLSPSFVEHVESIEPSDASWNWDEERGFISHKYGPEQDKRD